jgi:hypothetical protein
LKDGTKVASLARAGLSTYSSIFLFKTSNIKLGSVYIILLMALGHLKSVFKTCSGAAVMEAARFIISPDCKFILFYFYNLGSKL